MHQPDSGTPSGLTDAAERSEPAAGADVAGESLLPVRVRLTGMSERTSALLSWHLARARPQRLVEGSTGEPPQALFIDADHPDAAQALEMNRTGERLPVVLLTVDPDRHDIQPPVVEVMSKPVSATALDRVAGLLASGDMLALGDWDEDPDVADAVDPADSAIPLPTIEQDGAASSAAADEEEDAELRSRRAARHDVLFGTEREIEQARQDHQAGHTGSLDTLHYDPADHLGALLERELEKAGGDAVDASDTGSGTVPEEGPWSGFSVSLRHLELFVLPEHDRVYSTTTLRSVAISRRTFARIGPQVPAVTHYNGAGASVLLERVQKLARTGYTIDAFLWLAALMSSRGRLARGSDTQRLYRLCRWPNLTRLEPLPSSIEIAGCWARGPTCIDAVIERTGAHPRFVHAFYTAACTLGALVPLDDAAHQPSALDNSLQNSHG